MVNSITVPSFCLEINHKKMPDEMAYMVEEIKLEEEVNLPAALTVKLNAFDYKNEKWLELRDVKPGDQIRVGLGMSKVEWMMAGEVDGVNAELEEYAALEIRAYDGLRKLQRGIKFCSYTNMSDSDLAVKFAGEAGLDSSGVTTTPTKHPYLLQNNQSNYQFLLERARRIGYELLADENKLIFRPIPVKQEPAVTLELDKNLASFKTVIKSPVKGGKVEVRGWNMMTKEIITAMADHNSFEKMNPEKKTGHEWMKNADSTAVTIYDPGISDASDAELVAKAWYRSFLWDYINGEGQCCGEPNVRAGKTVKIKGTKNFDGIYYIVSTVHTLRRDECYNTSFKVKGTEL